MLIALHDGAIERLQTALTAIRNQDGETARALLVRCQMIVSGLAAGIDSAGGEISHNYRRLYEFVLHSIGSGLVDKLEGALQVLRTLRDGYGEARPEAVRLERDGTLPPLDNGPSLCALA